MALAKGRWTIPVMVYGVLACLSSLQVTLASSSALIVTGLGGSSANTEEFGRLATDTRTALIARGFKADSVQILSGKVTRQAILHKLKDTSADHEFWLILYGHSGRSQNGQPAFQISGPRLTAGDLKTALDAIPARQFVLIGTNDSAGYLPILQNPRRTTVAAARDGEGDQPRFPAAWVAVLAKDPRADFRVIAARASAAVAAEYENLQLAQIEHGRLADPASGKILEPPFGVDLASAKDSPPSPPAPAGALLTASDIKIEIKDPNAEWEQQAATEQTKKIMAAARTAPNPEGYAALVLKQSVSFTVEDDRTTDESLFYRVYLVRDEAVGQWANLFLPQNPPSVTSQLRVARVIRPDGAATVFNPAKLPAATRPADGGESGSPMVYLPGARAGCVVEIGYRTRQLLDATLPHVSEYIPLQKSAPVADTDLEIRVPAKQPFRVVLKNNTTNAQTTTENGRTVYRWHLGPLSAAEQLPGDPPPQYWFVAAGISSLPSWDDFAAWYRRLAQGSDKIDDTVKKTAAELSKGAANRMEILRRDYEFVSALRYVAIELGVQAFRPRTPIEVLAKRFGDCKDKANLLVALLQCQGIDARFVLLNRGGITDTDFPSWQFNHAICHVPAAPSEGQPEALWLDATDSVTPFGSVPPGDYGRSGFIIRKDSSEFKTVGGNGPPAGIQDTWTLRQTSEGGWQGTFQRRAGGLAEDGIRRMFRELAPAQRRTAVYHLLAGLWPGGDFSKPSVSDVGSLPVPVEIRSSVTAPTGAFPAVHVPGLDLFSPPDRDRPLWINDGQPLVVTQTLELQFAGQAPALPAPPWTVQSAGQKFTVTWEKTAPDTLRRVARAELTKPIVASADYASLRRAIRDWSSNLALTIKSL